MQSLLQIKLQDIKLYCYHGIDKGEDILGGEYLVNLAVSYVPAQHTVSNISETIDYTKLYSLIKKRMAIPTGLLETLTTEIASEIIAKFPLAEEVDITISKLHPPIERFEGSVAVNYKTSRK